MPCSVCNSIMIYDNTKKICPNCHGLKIVTKEEGSKYSQKLQEYIRKRYIDYLRKFDKFELIHAITLERENYSNSLLLSKIYNTVSIDKLFNLTFVISELIKYGFENRRGKRITDQVIKECFEITDNVVEVEVEHAKVKAGNSTVVLLEDRDADEIDTSKISSCIRIYENENYDNIRFIYKNNNIFTNTEAEEIKEETRKRTGEYEIEYRDFTAEEFISTCFEFIAPLYGALIRSRFYSEIFDIRNFQEIFNDPAQLMQLVWKFKKNKYAYVLYQFNILSLL